MTKRPVILCVEDEGNGLEGRRMMLEARGYNVLVAASGEEARTDGVSQSAIPGVFDNSSHRDEGCCYGGSEGAHGDGLFIGQSKEFSQFLTELAHEADSAEHECE